MRRLVLGALVIGCGSSQTTGDASPGDDVVQPDLDSGALDRAAPDAPASDASDAGAGDGGRDLSSDRNKFFGASRCAQANVQLCEDFESGMINPMIWSTYGQAPTVDGAQHARGAKAMHIKLGGNGLSAIKETKTFPAQNNTYWGRVFVYFHVLPTSPGMSYAHWTFVASSGTGAMGEIRLSGQLQNMKNLFGVGTDNAQGTGDWTNSDKDPNNMPVPVPVDQWLCVEWMHAGTPANETRFYWDAVEHPSLHTTQTIHGGNMNPYILPTFTNVWIGWQEYQPSNEPFELWVDEIAIDKDRIGCVL